MKFNFLFFGLAISLLLISCESESPRYIAKWKGIEVTPEVFKSQYVRYVSTAALGDSFGTRKDFANLLLERRIIAHKAQEQHFDTLEPVKNNIENAKELALIKYFVRSKIEPKISEPNEQEIIQAFEFTNTEIELEQIYAPSKTEIDSLYALVIENPDNFKKLAQNSMLQAGESAETYKMGWVTWNMMGLGPEKVSFQLEPGEISYPVSSSVGWHIFKAIDKKQTFYADGSTYQNAKESLAFTLKRRKFDEQSQLFIDSVLTSTEIVLFPEKLSQLWNYLAPKIPSNPNQINRVLSFEASNFDPSELPESTILATVDGIPLTVGEFIQSLPVIPHQQLQPNLRTAVETVAKDRLFSDMARAQNLSAHPEVMKESDIATTRALYNSYISEIADTLNLNRLQQKWLNKWQSQYIKDLEVSTTHYIFADSVTAQNALNEYRTRGNLDDNGNFKLSKRTVLYSEQPSYPAFKFSDIDFNSDDSSIWGPYKMGSIWTLILPIERKVIPYSLNEIQDKLKRDMKLRISEISHYEVLDSMGYNPSEVQYNDSLLKSILPFYF